MSSHDFVLNIKKINTTNEMWKCTKCGFNIFVDQDAQLPDVHGAFDRYFPSPAYDCNNRIVQRVLDD